jgi:flagellar basal-body rod modification protein FlgD
MADSVTGTKTALGAATATTGAKAKVNDRAMIADNFSNFLTLLTTQLKNQSPLDPLDTNQFTQQLVQFASVEQQLKSNDTLSSLLSSVRASTASTAASFVGMQVTADGTTSRLTKGQAAWMVNPARNAQASVTVTDSKGSVVAVLNTVLSPGNQSLNWDGTTSTGTKAPDGDYTISVSARDAAGQAVSVKTEIAGRVDSVDMSDTTPVLLVGSGRVPLDKVRSISRPTGT